MVVHRIRSFNRFYTQKIGLITSRFLKSRYTLVQARILFELSSRSPIYASDFTREFGLTPDYVSKLIGKFERQGLISRKPSLKDSRKQMISLTEKGESAYARLKEESNRSIDAMIQDLDPEQTRSLVLAMDTIEQVLGQGKAAAPLITLRSHRPGDIGSVIHRHGVIYAREYGFNHEFDAYVARGMADFVENYSDNDHLWIAESRGKFGGSVAIVRRSDTVAQLRWLIVEPGERGRGIGRRLVQEAIRFSRDHGYETIMLWTIDFLLAARKLYADAGFCLTETKTSRVWGKILTEECWALTLGGYHET